VEENMKKTFSAIVMLIILGLISFGCNSPSGPGGEETSTVEDKVITLNGTYSLDTGTEYKGAEIDISGNGLEDISKYLSVTVDAVLCDENESKIVLADGAETSGLGQFTLLKEGTSGWEEANRAAGPKYNMAIEGTTTLTVTSTDSGIPGKLLVEAPAAGQVKKIKVNTITFKSKPSGASDISFQIVYGDSYVSAEGNKLTFTNASNSSGAALFTFPSSWLPLTGKTITVSYTLVSGYDPDLEHQIIIQAANGLNDVNYDGSYQQYIDMDTGDSSASGSFTIDGTTLEESAANKSPSFSLSGMRIVNNGGSWTDTSAEPNVTHNRESSYSVIFDSITVE
jgi:hypothetical protein